MADLKLEFKDDLPDSKLRVIELNGFRQVVCTCTVHSNLLAVWKSQDGRIQVRCPRCDTDWPLTETLDLLNK